MADVEYDLVVVGGGVLGTFHAYHALKKGLRVALFEKDRQPQGATVRNFGQVKALKFIKKYKPNVILVYGKKDQFI